MMMWKGSRLIMLLNIVLFMAYLGYGIGRNERVLASGRLILLELSPVDPRSLLQGDYMQLAYRLADLAPDTLKGIPIRGYVVLHIDARGVAGLRRFQPTHHPFAAGEVAIPYRHNGQALSIGAESFFFQEGKAARYERAHYGGLRVDDRGTALLVGLWDAGGHPIQ